MCEPPSWRLEPQSFPSHLTSINTCGITTALKVHGDTILLSKLEMKKTLSSLDIHLTKLFKIKVINVVS